MDQLTFVVYEYEWNLSVICLPETNANVRMGECANKCERDVCIFTAIRSISHILVLSFIPMNVDGVLGIFGKSAFHTFTFGIIGRRNTD